MADSRLELLLDRVAEIVPTDRFVTQYELVQQLDTTSAVLVWPLAELSRRGRIQARLRFTEDGWQQFMYRRSPK